MLGDINYELGIDIGGTFTDLTLKEIDGSGIWNVKTPTVPKDPASGISNGLQLLKEKGIDLTKISYFVHGMTIGLNTLLQRNGARIGLFVTEGFRDILSIQRLRLPVPYDLHSRLPESLIERQHVYPIKERMQADGEAFTSLDMNDVDQAIDQAVEAGLEGLVVSFLHSYRNSAHELQVVERIKERAPHLYVEASSSIWTEMREYERTVIAAMNVYIQPNVKRYFETLVERLEQEGIQAKPFITQSNGGLMEIHAAADQPVKTLFSGPAAGVMGAVQAADASGIDNVITFDVGGTSADISLIEGGEILYTQTNELGGLPTILPSVAIYSIGAGGGSLAWIDKGGILKVGPLSAGSDPGPACYGRGEEPALTDAFLLSGYLNSASFAGGNVGLNQDRSAAAFQKIADHLQSNVLEAADQSIQVAVANMFTELSNVLEQHGIDPNDFSLMAFGGAGPVLANMVAEEIQAKQVIIPANPGNLCAQGSLAADFVYDAITSRQVLLIEMDKAEWSTIFTAMEQEATDWLNRQQVDAFLQSTQLHHTIDARYKGQAFELEVPFQLDWLEADPSLKLAEIFHAQHERLYGHSDPNASIELMNFKVRIVGETAANSHATAVLNDKSLEPGERSVRINGQTYSAAIVDRTVLQPGMEIQGPAIIEQQDTTTVVLPSWKAKTDEAGNLLLERKEMN
ncbi:N-methylhydantoinase A [Terribacillus saccharophilus]|uniref:N-methylhydantoinase A n=1 Tax=Terribacillus saccharophilus TaxID=361277 RepID=A0AAX2EJX1_9BACI|nr:N-methylhydantoinase A [Terribacillus saccharophilus]